MHSSQIVWYKVDKGWFSNSGLHILSKFLHTTPIQKPNNLFYLKPNLVLIAYWFQLMKTVTEANTYSTYCTCVGYVYFCIIKDCVFETVQFCSSCKSHAPKQTVNIISAVTLASIARHKVFGLSTSWIHQCLIVVGKQQSVQRGRRSNSRTQTSTWDVHQWKTGLWGEPFEW